VKFSRSERLKLSAIVTKKTTVPKSISTSVVLMQEVTELKLPLLRRFLFAMFYINIYMCAEPVGSTAVILVS
jgi:hypothetical protein